MKTDTRATHPMTIADLCQAISEERIGYARRGERYEVSGLNIARFLRGDQPQGQLEPPHVAIDPAALESGCTA